MKIKSIAAILAVTAALGSFSFAQKIKDPAADAKARAQMTASMTKMSAVAKKMPKSKRMALTSKVAAKSAKMAAPAKGAKKLSLNAAAVDDAEKAIPFFIGQDMHGALTATIFQDAAGLRKALEISGSVYKGSKVGEMIEAIVMDSKASTPKWDDMKKAVIEVYQTFSAAYPARSAEEGFNFNVGFNTGKVVFGATLLAEKDLEKQAKDFIAGGQSEIKKELAKAPAGISSDLKTAAQKVADVSSGDSAAINSAAAGLMKVYLAMLG